MDTMDTLANYTNKTMDENFSEAPISKTKIINDDLRDIFFGVNLALLCGGTCLSGIVSNVINIIVFAKMGFRETINISLFGLAISDLCSLITLFWVTVCFNPLFYYSDLPFMPFEISHVIGGWPHVYFTRVTGWITAYVTFERFLCIAYPLKVKLLVTKTRVKGIIITIFIVIMISISPIYYVNILVWGFSETVNKSVLMLAFTEDREEKENIVYLVSNFISPMISFTLVVFFTLMLVFKLRQKTKWRQTSASTPTADKKEKDTQIAKMMITVSTIFIFCFLPTIGIFVYMSMEPEFSIVGAYANLLCVTFSFAYILEGANASVNIFVYYRMSSKYKAVFNQVFGRSVEK